MYANLIYIPAQLQIWLQQNIPLSPSHTLLPPVNQKYVACSLKSCKSSSTQKKKENIYSPTYELSNPYEELIELGINLIQRYQMI